MDTISRFSPETQIEVTFQTGSNPQMNYKYFMVPGILVILLTMIGTNPTTAINIVKEKNGTIEQINVTLVKKYHFILGKLIPFWLFGLFTLTLGLTTSRLAHGILPAGSFHHLCICSCLLVGGTRAGVVISTYSAIQQQSMLLSFLWWWYLSRLAVYIHPSIACPNGPNGSPALTWFLFYRGDGWWYWKEAPGRY